MKKVFLKFIKIFKNLFFLRLELFFYNIKTLLSFQILFKLITVLIASPLLYWTIDRCLNLSDNTYINDDNFLSAMCNPIILIIAIICLIVAAMYTLFDISAQLYIFEKSRRSEKTKLSQTIKFAIFNSLRLLKTSNILLYLFILVLMPFLNIGVMSSSLGNIVVPASTMEIISSNIYVSIIVLILIIVMVLLSFKLIFTLQYFTLEQNNAISSFNKSIHLNRSHRISNFISMACIQILISLVNSVFLFISNNLLTYTYTLSFDNNAAMQIIAFIVTIAFFVIYIIISSLYLPLSSLKITSIYYSNKTNMGEKILNIDLDHIYTESFPWNKISKLNNKVKTVSTIALSLFIAIIIFFAGYNKATIDNIDNANNTNTQVISDFKFTYNSNISEEINISKKLGVSAIYITAFNTLDDQIVCTSNSNSYNTLKIAGVDIEETTYSDLKDYLSNKKIKSVAIDSNEGLSTLDEILDYCNNINLGILLDTTKIDKDLDTKILNTINKHGNENIIIADNNIEFLKKFNAPNVNAQTAYKQTIVYGDFSEFKDTIDYLMLDSISFSENQIDTLHECGIKTIIYGLNGIDDNNTIKQAQQCKSEYVCCYLPRSAIKTIDDANDNQFNASAYKRYEIINFFKDLV